jgi:monofunctional biosynthetic peptidoglycan transglycosylase
MRWIAGLSVLALLAAGLSVLVGSGLPDPRPLRDPAWVQQRFKLGEWVPLEQVNPLAVRAILLSEDDTFFHNHGLRMDQLGPAAWEDLLAMRYKRGASSLTQQVVKNAFLGEQKSLLRKLRELWLAHRASALVPKKRLLEDYLNLAEWGPHKERGISFAARFCFGKTPAQLDAKDGALLSWMLPDPRHRALWIRRGQLPEGARRHIALLLGRLQDEGSLDPASAAALAAQPFAFERHPGPPLAPDTDDEDDE